MTYIYIYAELGTCSIFWVFLNRKYLFLQKPIPCSQFLHKSCLKSLPPVKLT